MILTEQKLYELIIEQDNENKLVSLLISSLENARIAVDLMINAEIPVDDQIFMLEKALMSVRKYEHKTFLNNRLDELADEQDFEL